MDVRHGESQGCVNPDGVKMKIVKNIGNFHVFGLLKPIDVMCW